MQLSMTAWSDFYFCTITTQSRRMNPTPGSGSRRARPGRLRTRQQAQRSAVAGGPGKQVWDVRSCVTQFVAGLLMFPLPRPTQGPEQARAVISATHDRYDNRNQLVSYAVSYDHKVGAVQLGRVNDACPSAPLPRRPRGHTLEQAFARPPPPNFPNARTALHSAHISVTHDCMYGAYAAPGVRVAWAPEPCPPSPCPTHTHTHTHAPPSPARLTYAHTRPLPHSTPPPAAPPLRALAHHHHQLGFHHWRANAATDRGTTDPAEPIEGVGLIAFNKHLQVGRYGC